MGDTLAQEGVVMPVTISTWTRSRVLTGHRLAILGRQKAAAGRVGGGKRPPP